MKQGTATDIKMALAGDLAEFPFADSRRGQFLVTFKASDATLDYADGWPEVTGIDADVKFEGTGMVIDAAAAGSSARRRVRSRWTFRNLGVAASRCSRSPGEATGTTTEFLQFIDKSPVAGWIGHFTDGAQADGNGKLTLKCRSRSASAQGRQGRRRLPVHRQPVALARRARARAGQRPSRVRASSRCSRATCRPRCSAAWRRSPWQQRRPRAHRRQRQRPISPR